MSASHPLSGYEDGVYAERDRLRAINAELRAMSDPKVRKWACEVWVLVDADGYIFATTVSYTRKDCLAIPHEEGVKCVRAVLTLKPPPRRKGDK